MKYHPNDHAISLSKMSLALQQSTLAFILTLLLIASLSRVAPRFGLVDTPDHRKQHVGSIPVVGGIAIMLTLLVMASIWQGHSNSVLASNGHTLWYSSQPRRYSPFWG
jgi:UDP-N-acetylmuramyl pentapeptide phosphotransferase/UDP-N-acetylglucosamine-1-phosphate transferase